jgi:hypothetical protein
MHAEEAKAGRQETGIAKALFLFSCLVIFLVLCPNKLICCLFVHQTIFKNDEAFSYTPSDWK